MTETANVTIDDYPFVCVPLFQSDFKEVAAIYVIICVKSGGSWSIIDVGQSGQLGNRIDHHDRIKCWGEKCSTENIWVCIHKMPSDKYTIEDRRRREKEIRSKHTGLCGER
ncbi:MAG: hypothetical protein AUJ85_00420 [Elusimicrobia bacterium CG1_02_37_114]|nr:MAG: hypothetical protein AUJ85_00420 [Elusimicrobia bacterium CG1_02_37_114]PIV53161.1 MAG: hypothetical protein COS17_05535 [Elusimicrobia bacterium CG02_land_8_20_14_3_00_37_13]PIZ13908.1 MAG: hypothetical protein COY53_02530 [Elusimicrobia bacterium CG_4_10_14_0_8_um_filter_37_32]